MSGDQLPQVEYSFLHPPQETDASPKASVSNRFGEQRKRTQSVKFNAQQGSLRGQGIDINKNQKPRRPGVTRKAELFLVNEIRLNRRGHSRKGSDGREHLCAAGGRSWSCPKTHRRITAYGGAFLTLSLFSEQELKQVFVLCDVAHLADEHDVADTGGGDEILDGTVKVAQVEHENVLSSRSECYV